MVTILMAMTERAEHSTVRHEQKPGCFGSYPVTTDPDAPNVPFFTGADSIKCRRTCGWTNRCFVTTITSGEAERQKCNQGSIFAVLESDALS